MNMSLISRVSTSGDVTCRSSTEVKGARLLEGPRTAGHRQDAAAGDGTHSSYW
jgi:hypothetical protein